MAEVHIYDGGRLWTPGALQRVTLADIKTLWGEGIGPENVLLPYVNDGHTFIVTAVTEEGQLAGLARVCVSETKSFRYGTVHDVVVKEKYRGQKIGPEIMDTIIEWGRTKGLRYLDLTCKPARVAANKIYPRVGFLLLSQAVNEEGTNYYRYYYSQ